jgi:hypothetical protein
MPARRPARKSSSDCGGAVIGPALLPNGGYRPVAAPAPRPAAAAAVASGDAAASSRPSAAPASAQPAGQQQPGNLPRLIQVGRGIFA